MADPAARLSQISKYGIVEKEVPYIAGLAATTTAAEPAAAASASKAWAATRGAIPVSVSNRLENRYCCFDPTWQYDLCRHNDSTLGLSHHSRRHCRRRLSPNQRQSLSPSQQDRLHFEGNRAPCVRLHHLEGLLEPEE